MGRYNVIDLFAGCGGFSVGFEQAGFNIVKAVEFDKQIAQTYLHNHKDTKLYIDDIARVDTDEFFERGESDVIIGGPPCQGFSMAGARIRNGAFLDDPRNYLFKHYVNIVNIVRPKMFILENVKGILTMQKGEIFNEILKTFSDKKLFNGDKYYLHYKVVRAVEFGIPQKRERVVLIGMLNTDFDIDLMFEEVKKQININNPHFFEPVSVWEAISDIETPTESGITTLLEPTTPYQKALRCGCAVTTNHIATEHNKRSCKRMKQIQEGENWVKLNEPIHSVHSGAYGRLEKDKPAATITTRFDTPSGGRFIHPVADRTITPREAARLQSFPDNFEFVGTKSSVCKQIGNAVPPKLSYFLANLVKYALYENN